MFDQSRKNHEKTAQKINSGKSLTAAAAAAAALNNPKSHVRVRYSFYVVDAMLLPHTYRHTYQEHDAKNFTPGAAVREGA